MVRPSRSDRESNMSVAMLEKPSLPPETVPHDHSGQRRGARQPASRASRSLQNQRSPRETAMRVAA